MAGKIQTRSDLAAALDNARLQVDQVAGQESKLALMRQTLSQVAGRHGGQDAILEEEFPQIEEALEAAGFEVSTGRIAEGDRERLRQEREDQAEAERAERVEKAAARAQEEGKDPATVDPTTAEERRAQDAMRGPQAKPLGQ